MKYSVNVHYDLVYHVDVEADTEEDAIEKAIEESSSLDPLNDGYFNDVDACVTYIYDE